MWDVVHIVGSSAIALMIFLFSLPVSNYSPKAMTTPSKTVTTPRPAKGKAKKSSKGDLCIGEVFSLSHTYILPMFRSWCNGGAHTHTHTHRPVPWGHHGWRTAKQQGLGPHHGSASPFDQPLPFISDCAVKLKTMAYGGTIITEFKAQSVLQCRGKCRGKPGSVAFMWTSNGAANSKIKNVCRCISGTFKYVKRKSYISGKICVWDVLLTPSFRGGVFKLCSWVILELWKVHFSSQFGDLHW